VVGAFGGEGNKGSSRLERGPETDDMRNGVRVGTEVMMVGESGRVVRVDGRFGFVDHVQRSEGCEGLFDRMKDLEGRSPPEQEKGRQKRARNPGPGRTISLHEQIHERQDISLGVRQLGLDHGDGHQMPSGARTSTPGRTTPASIGEWSPSGSGPRE